MEHESKDIEEQGDFPEEESILETPQSQKKKRKRHPFRWLVVLLILFGAFLYLQQYYLDLEAEALVYAQQTATALGVTIVPLPVEKKLMITQIPPAISSTTTASPNFSYTQTVGVQLTEVAEFQQTRTAK